jgi:enoyl-CoA hydratase/carnithine racemase
MSDALPYAERFETIRFERRDGILQMTLHTEGGPLRWGAAPVAELQQAFAAVAADTDNRVVILTGTGDEFNGPKGSPETFPIATARGWEFSHWNVRKLLWNLLDIEAPMIAAINGPVWRHAETPLLCDIVLAAEHTVFQDSGHYVNGLVPGDGIQLVLPLLLGLNRARYFMLTGQVIDARAALDLGMVAEVLPADRLVPRAWELAEQLARQSPMVTRYTKAAFAHTIRQHLVTNHGYGLLLEGMACIDDSSTRTGYSLPERG